ncbi:proteasome complex subunit Rpn13 ubiquitin receptor-domain-containing protein [Lyophyllum atratum]|nr:proteasome complex subunit Rpn13 ubiquitin receptor-domain-containing protein [Lyophyllum atratum]
MAETLLAFKAGRAFRRPGTNLVDPRPEKGAIVLTNGDDGLLHFTWKNRSTGDVQEDLILFPSDASFVRVSQAPGRVYVLKFSSSDQRHFDASSDRDEEFVNNVNGLLDDPEYTLQWGSTTSATSEQQASTSTLGSSSTQPTSNFQATPEQLAQLEALIRGSAAGRGAPSPPEMSLTDILTPANLSPLFASHPELIPTLFPHLPPDLPMPPSADVLNRIINSPQFRSAVASFDQALRTGLLGGLAGTGIVPFLTAVQEQANRERGGDSMETD